MTLAKAKAIVAAAAAKAIVAAAAAADVQPVIMDAPAGVHAAAPVVVPTGAPDEHPGALAGDVGRELLGAFMLYC